MVPPHVAAPRPFWLGQPSFALAPAGDGGGGGQPLLTAVNTYGGQDAPAEAPPLPANLNEASLQDYAQTYGKEALSKAVENELGIDPKQFFDPDGTVNWKGLAAAAIKNAYGVDAGPLINAATADGGIDWDTVAREASGIAGFAVCEALGAPLIVSAAVCQPVGRLAYDLVKAVYKYGAVALEALASWVHLGSDDPVDSWSTYAPTDNDRVSMVAAWYGTTDRDRATRIMTLRSVTLLTLSTIEAACASWQAQTGQPITWRAMLDVFTRNGLIFPKPMWDLVGFNPANDAYRAGGVSDLNPVVEEWYVVSLTFGQSVAATKYDQPEWFLRDDTLKSLWGQSGGLASRRFGFIPGWDRETNGTHFGGKPFLSWMQDDVNGPLDPGTKKYKFFPSTAWSYFRVLDSQLGTFLYTPVPAGYASDGYALVPAGGQSYQERMDAYFDWKKGITFLTVSFNSNVATLNSDAATGAVREIVFETLQGAAEKTAQQMRWAKRNQEVFGTPLTTEAFVAEAPPAPGMMFAGLPEGLSVEPTLISPTLLATYGAPDEAPAGLGTAATVALGTAAVAAAWTGWRMYTHKPILPASLTGKKSRR